MKDNGNIREARQCPKCGRIYYERPALSRTDNETLICQDCGTREALESIGVSVGEQDKILATIHRSMLGTTLKAEDGNDAREDRGYQEMD